MLPYTCKCGLGSWITQSPWEIILLSILAYGYRSGGSSTIIACIRTNSKDGPAALILFTKMWKTEFPWIRISGGCMFTRCGLCEFLKGAASSAKNSVVRDTIIYRFSPIWPISSHSFNFISRPSIMSACASDVNVAPFRWFMLSISPGPCAGPPVSGPPVPSPPGP